MDAAPANWTPVFSLANGYLSESIISPSIPSKEAEVEMLRFLLRFPHTALMVWRMYRDFPPELPGVVLVRPKVTWRALAAYTFRAWWFTRPPLQHRGG
jgi:hypothetical protein